MWEQLPVDLAGGNLTGVYERMVSEKWCMAKPDTRVDESGEKDGRVSS